MSEPEKSVERPLDQIAEPNRIGEIKCPSVGLFYAGMSFLIGSLLLFFVGGLVLYEIDPNLLITTTPNQSGYYAFLRPFIIPGFLFLAWNVCTYVGIRLLKAAGAMYSEVIPRGEYELLAQLIKDGNEKAISQYIRLSSLAGLTGTFEKIGLTGLPLATMVLTIILTILSLKNDKVLDLAKLTLGAFIGSYVQKKRERPEG